MLFFHHLDDGRADDRAVALDPDAKRLVRDTMAQGFRLPIELYAIEKVLRFPVLAHWSFTTNEGATFETLMQDLDVGLLGTVPERLLPPAPTSCWAMAMRFPMPG